MKEKQAGGILVDKEKEFRKARGKIELFTFYFISFLNLFQCVSNMFKRPYNNYDHILITVISIFIPHISSNTHAHTQSHTLIYIYIYIYIHMVGIFVV